MYSHRVYTIHEYAIRFEDGCNALDVLLDTITTARDFCESKDINVEDLTEARWEITGWPTDSSPEHLVVTLKIND